MREKLELSIAVFCMGVVPVPFYQIAVSVLELVRLSDWLETVSEVFNLVDALFERLIFYVSC